MSKSGNLAALAAILNPSDQPILFFAEDPPYLPRILVFYWPVQALGSLASTSRIRTTILTAAGFKSFGAFQVSPASAYYSAVHKLPEEKQRDDVYRGVAFGLCRYFSEITPEVKTAIADECPLVGGGPKWGQAHAAQITCRLDRVLNVDEVVDALRQFSKERPASPTVPVRPLASIRKTRPSFMPQDATHNVTSRFGPATPAKRVPSSQSRRTPSSSTPGPAKSSPSRGQKQTIDQLESLRFKMCEFVDTEDRYVSKLQELIELVTTQSRTARSLSSKSSQRGQKAVNAMLQFPALLDQIRELNLAFLDDIESSLQGSEDAAMQFFESAQSQPDGVQLNAKDPVGAYNFAKVLLHHFPKFPVPYREYLDLHSQVSSNLDQFFKASDNHPSQPSVSIQHAPSLLMEPAQRISRYGLYIDTMLPHLPSSSTLAHRTFEKARKIIAEICEMEPAASTILDGLRIEHETRHRPFSPTKLLSNLTRSAATGMGSIRESPNLREQNTPRLMPSMTSLSRSFSRKKTQQQQPSRSGPLVEQDVDQANNTSTTLPRNDENSRPNSNGSIARRPNTASSAASGHSFSLRNFGNHNSNNAVKEKEKQGEKEREMQVRLDKVEEENYRLLKENAELKRQLRTCTCQRR